MIWATVGAKDWRAVLSCHDFVDNQVRLHLFVLACNQGNFLRQAALPKTVRRWTLTTLREKLIKIGAKVVRHSRKIVFQMRRWRFRKSCSGRFWKKNRGEPGKKARKSVEREYDEVRENSEKVFMKLLLHFRPLSKPFYCLLGIFGMLVSQNVRGQGAAFTYQGSLTLNGAPANGSFDMVFALYQTGAGGTPVTEPVTNAATSVSNGLFTVVLDFGSGIFNGANYWLDVSVQTNNGAGFTELTPRQPITPSPYAIFAPNAGTTAAFSGPVALSQLPSAVLTNGATITGVFNGSGAGLTNLSASELTTGTLGQALLPPTVLTMAPGNVATNVYASPGVYTVEVPAGVTQIIAKLWGAGGGGDGAATGGGGAFVQTILPVVPGQFFTVVVGQHGDASDNNAGGSGANDAPGGNGTGNQSFGGQGGQASSLFYDEPGANYIMEAVAGGGGGAGYAPSPGGDGGNPGGDGGNSEEGLQLGTGGLGGGDGTGGFGGESEKGKFHGSTGADYAGNASSTGIFSPDSADGNGGDGDTNGDGGGGGGGGYGGGGGGCIGGGGGGGCYGQIIIGGANGVAGDNSDPNYIASAGNSTSADGEDGLVVLIFGNPANVTVPAKISANSFAGDGSSLTNIQLINVVSALPSNAVYHLTGNVSGGFAQSPLFIENTDTNTSCGPALRLQADGSATPDGALSVSSQNNDSSSIIARFGNASAFVCTISNNGSISARGTIYVNGVALTSDRDAKENFVPVDSATLLDRVAALPISEWNYKTDPADKRHLGPMAQDFQAAFGLDGNDNKHISLVDEGGIALAAIQGLNQKVDEKDALIQKQAAEIADLKARLEKLEKLIK